MADINGGASRADRFFDTALQQFRGLAQTRGATVSRHIALGGRKVRIEVSTGAMERAIMRGLSHLTISEATEPDLVLHAWDSESTGAPSVSPGWEVGEGGGEGYLRGFNDQRFHAAVQFGPIIFRMLDMKRRCALYWTQSAAKLPYWEIGAPMRPLLHEWLRRVGLLAVHGGAVGQPGGGVFLAGVGGRGKSNVALACLDSQLYYASDDFCFLSRSPDWTVHSLYCTGKIAAGDFPRHPHLRGAESNPDRLDREKALFFLSEKFGDRLIRDMPLRAIALPHVIGSGPSEIVRLTPATAQKEIAMSTIAMLRSTGRDTFAKVAELVRDLPCYELRVGAALREVPALLQQLLTDLGENRVPRALH